MDYVHLSLATNTAAANQNTSDATVPPTTAVFTLSEGAGPSTASDFTPPARSSKSKYKNRIKNKRRNKGRKSDTSKNGPKSTSSKQHCFSPGGPVTSAGCTTGLSTLASVGSTVSDTQDATTLTYSFDAIIPDILTSPDPSTMATLTYSYVENPFVLMNDASPPRVLNTSGLPVNEALPPHIALQDLSNLVGDLQSEIDQGLQQLRRPQQLQTCETNVDDEFSRMAKSRSNTPDRDSKQ